MGSKCMSVFDTKHSLKNMLTFNEQQHKFYYLVSKCARACTQAKNYKAIQVSAAAD